MTWSVTDKQYRVVKHGYRRDTDGAALVYYTVEELISRGSIGAFLHGEKTTWKTMKKFIRGISEYGYWGTIYFDTQEKACDYVARLKMPVSDREVITCLLS